MHKCIFDWGFELRGLKRHFSLHLNFCLQTLVIFETVIDESETAFVHKLYNISG